MVAYDVCNVSSQYWDLTLPENEHTLTSAPYTPLEKFFLTIITITGVIGLVANLVGLFTIIRQRSEWDNYKIYLACLASADLLLLLCGLVFFLAPIANSPVSFDVPFTHCYTLIGFVLFAQVVSTGLIVAIAVETYLRIYRGTDVALLNSTKWLLVSLIIIVLVAIVVVPAAVPNVFQRSNTFCVRWPDLPKYADFPQRIKICPPAIFATLMFIIIHDVPVFIIAPVILSVLYGKVIQRIAHPSTTLSEEQKTETVINLRSRILVFIVCHAMALFYDVADAISRYSYGEPVLPIPSVKAEIVYFVFRLLILIQAAINPFMYFLIRDQYRPLVKKAFGRSD